MSNEIPGLGIFAGHQVIKKVDNDVEVEITTGAHLQDSEAGYLVRHGWVRRAPNVFAWLKPQYSDKLEDPVEEPPKPKKVEKK